MTYICLPSISRLEGKGEKILTFEYRNDTQKASEYGLTGGVVLHLVLALRGGRISAE